MKEALFYFILILSSLFVVSKGDIQISYSGNVSWSTSKLNEFHFRKTNLAKISIPLLFTGAWFSSISADINSNTTQSSGLFASIYAGIQLAPTSALAYYSTTFDYSNINYYSFDVSASAGFIGAEYLSLTEKSGSTVVSEKKLKNLIWTLGDSKSNEGLHYITIRGTELFSRFEILVTFISSDNVGYINYQNSDVGAIVTPKTLESIVEINNYPYKSSSNYLTLTMGTATGNFDVVASASANNLISGSGTDNQVYFALSKEAVIDGSKRTVTISSFTKIGTGSGGYIEGQAKGKYGGSFNYATVTVDFPVGASRIIYDPTIGQGTPPTIDPISGVAIFFIIFGIGVFIAAIVFVIFFLYRKGYFKKGKRPYVAYRG